MSKIQSEGKTGGATGVGAVTAGSDEPAKEPGTNLVAGSAQGDVIDVEDSPLNRTRRITLMRSAGITDSHQHVSISNAVLEYTRQIPFDEPVEVPEFVYEHLVGATNVEISPDESGRPVGRHVAKFSVRVH